MITLLLGLFINCNVHEQTAGTVDDSDTGITVYLPDHTPAVNAVVKFIPSTRSQTPGLVKKLADSIAMAIIKTDSKGQFKVPTLADSTYNVFRKGDLKAFQGSVIISSQGNTLHDDTLRQTGSFSAVVCLDPKDMHNINSVAIQILGSDVEYINADKSGMFSFENVAAGSYKLRLETTLPEYSPTFFTMNVQSGIDTVYSDTICLTYTGIPTVQGLSATIDTGTAIVGLKWAKSEYSNLLDYVIYRDAEPTITYSSVPFRATSDTFLLDTIFDIQKISAETKFEGYRYRVAIRNNSTTIGSTFGSVSIHATPYKSAIPAIDSLQVTFDTSKGIVQLSWRNELPIDSNYNYYLVRNITTSGSNGNETISRDTIGIVQSQTYSDTLFDNVIAFNDTLQHKVTYEVSVFRKDWGLTGKSTISLPLILTPYINLVPVVTGCNIEFDTLNGIAHIIWDSLSAESGVDEFRVIRSFRNLKNQMQYDTINLIKHCLLGTIYPTYFHLIIQVH